MYKIHTFSSISVCINLSQIKQLGYNNKIVKPDWITDSIRANKLLNYTNYLLYTNQNRLQPKLKFPKLKKNNNNIQNACENQNNEELENPTNNSNLNLKHNDHVEDNNLDKTETEHSEETNNINKDREGSNSPELFSDEDVLIENKKKNRNDISESEKIKHRDGDGKIRKNMNKNSNTMEKDNVNEISDLFDNKGNKY